MNLFLCSTPLQLKIAARIIEVEALANVTVLFTGIMPNRRNEFYLQQLERLADEIVYFNKNVCLEKSRSAYLNQQARAVIDKYALQNAKSIYLANLNDRFYHHLLSLLPGRAIYTYDDGTENVNQLSKFFRNKQYSWFRKRVQRHFGRKFWLEEVLASTECHYTIYEHLPNVVKNTRFIPLYAPKFTTEIPNKTINILLGTVYRDVVQDRNNTAMLIADINSYVKVHEIDLYIPHPREETLHFDNCQALIPEQMSEEVIMGYLEQGYKVHLYGFGGSTQLNLDSVAGVTNYLFESPLISERVRNGYQLFYGHVKHLKLPNGK